MPKASFIFLKDPEKDHTDRIDCKVGKDMYDPGGVDSFALKIKKIQYYSAYKESENDESGKSKGIPSYHHRNMIERKTYRAENARPLLSDLIGKPDESEAAEDKFLEE